MGVFAGIIPGPAAIDYVQRAKRYNWASTTGILPGCFSIGLPAAVIALALLGSDFRSLF
jgi:hypothetical protein